MEDLSDASFLSKLLVLPANVRLDWKVFASLFGIVISKEEKKLYNVDLRRMVSVAVAPSTITISFADGGEAPIDCRVRFLSFLGIGQQSIQYCAFIVHTAQVWRNNF